MAQSKRTIRASEIGSFIFCQRAWRYQRNEVKSINVDELAAGEDFHQIHVNQSRSAGILRVIAWVILVVFIILLSLTITGVLK